MPVLEIDPTSVSRGSARCRASSSGSAYTSRPRRRTFLKTLKAGGATVVACASNPLSTQDDVAAALVVDEGTATVAVKGESHEQLLPPHRRGPRRASAADPGRRMRPRVPIAPAPSAAARASVIGGTEETTTGVIRLRAMAGRRRAGLPDRRRQRRSDQAAVRQPVRHGPVDARRHHPLRRTCCWLARSSWSPATAVAARASRPGRRGMGAIVTVTEIDAATRARGGHGRVPGRTRWPRPPGRARSSSRSRATVTCFRPSTSHRCVTAPSSPTRVTSTSRSTSSRSRAWPRTGVGWCGR